MGGVLCRGSDNRLRSRVGRMKTPYLYEYCSIAEGDLIPPERSLYAGNRQNGAIFVGELFKGRLGDAAVIFKGPRGSFRDDISSKDLFLYRDAHPSSGPSRCPRSTTSASDALSKGGNENNPTQPDASRTANDRTNSSTAARFPPTCLACNNNVTALRNHEQRTAHVAYFCRGPMVLGEYAGGTKLYAINHADSMQVGKPVESPGPRRVERAGDVVTHPRPIAITSSVSSTSRRFYIKPPFGACNTKCPRFV